MTFWKRLVGHGGPRCRSVGELTTTESVGCGLPVTGFRGHQSSGSKTGARRRPRWTRRRAAPISSGGPANGSRSRTTRSAAAPGASTPAPSCGRGRSPTPSPRCTPRTPSRGRAPARAGTARCRPARVAVRRAGDRGVDRGQRVGRARPASRCPRPAGRRPGAASPKGYCHVDRSSPRNGMRQVDHLRRRGRPTAPACSRRRRARRTAARRRGGPPAGGRCGGAGRRRGRPSRGRERVERLARAAVADGVHVHLEALGVERGDGLLQRLGVDERVAGVVGGVAAAVEVRREQRGGEVLGHAVLHDLDGGRAEPAAGQRLARRSTRSATCSTPELAVPPERADDVRATRSPLATASTYVEPGSSMPAYAPTIASCQPVTPSECR